MTMKHLQSYLNTIKKDELSESINDTVNAVIENHLKKFSFRDNLTGLLLGNIQSGKTGQMFGIIAAAADLGFELFVLLTTDNTELQKQTYERALHSFDTFTVCDVNDWVRFKVTNMRRPALIILNKNTNILKTWKNNLISSGFCEGRAIFIIDDEGDAASMNTKINKQDFSSIYKHLIEMKKLANSSVYLQVTATPQPILLQSKELSELKPDFVHYFPPGKGYLGGDFFYSDPASYVIKTTDENEIEDIRITSNYIPPGLRKSTLSFLVAGAHIMLTGGKVCNFLIHPSVSIKDHEQVAEKLGEFLNEILNSDFEEIIPELKTEWDDLQKTKPDIKNFNLIKEYIEDILNEMRLNIWVMNSKSSQDIQYDKGLNIIIGGNSLGRGVTFEGLQTVYYCRKSKSPQADTFWQHCRMFGYDRDAGLIRVFIPQSLLNLFVDLNKSNQALIEQVRDYNLDEISLIYPPNIKPTRKNVVHQLTLNHIIGGANYFPREPKGEHLEELDNILGEYNEENHKISLELMIRILQMTENEKKKAWNNQNYISCLQALISENIKDGFLIVRKNRDIKKGTGTLLSPDDRLVGMRITKVPVLTMYRLTGTTDKGWQGKPLWIPNIKFPHGKNFYKTD